MTDQERRDELLRTAGSHLSRTIAALDTAGERELARRALVLANDVLLARRAVPTSAGTEG